MYYVPAGNPSIANQQLQRFMRENLGTASSALGARRRPGQVQNLRVSALVQAIALSWIGPQNLAGILGYNIYQGTESNPVQNVVAPQYPSASSQGSTLAVAPTVKATISGLITGTTYAFYVSSYTSLLESVKLQILGVPA